MKKLIAIILLVVGGTALANFMVFYNPTSFVITNRTTRVIGTVNPDAADGRDDAKVVDTLPGGFDVATHKWDGSAFVPLTAGDNAAIAATNAILSFNAQVAFTNAVRIQAKQWLQDQFSEQDLLHRAMLLVIMDEINILRANDGLGARTKVQLRNAIQSQIDAGADTIE